jgi:hypothetical protein
LGESDSEPLCQGVSDAAEYGHSKLLEFGDVLSILAAGMVIAGGVFLHLAEKHLSPHGEAKRARPGSRFQVLDRMCFTSTGRRYLNLGRVCLLVGFLVGILSVA